MMTPDQKCQLYQSKVEVGVCQPITVMKNMVYLGGQLPNTTLYTLYLQNLRKMSSKRKKIPRNSKKMSSQILQNSWEFCADPQETFLETQRHIVSFARIEKEKHLTYSGVIRTFNANHGIKFCAIRKEKLLGNARKISPARKISTYCTNQEIYAPITF